MVYILAFAMREQHHPTKLVSFLDSALAVRSLWGGTFTQPRMGDRGRCRVGLVHGVENWQCNFKYYIAYSSSTAFSFPCDLLVIPSRPPTSIVRRRHLLAPSAAILMLLGDLC